MTAWAERLEQWRNPAMWDEPPTEERAVSQLVYGAIWDFIEQRADVLAEALHTDKDGRVIDALINDWIDATATPTADQTDSTAPE